MRARARMCWERWERLVVLRMIIRGTRLQVGSVVSGIGCKWDLRSMGCG